ncbi:MAG: hypothetical protein FWH52_06930, partial [Synergistaceae bacterium]|nr:hypothetical protein [Synergistaceae bacterium]
NEDTVKIALLAGGKIDLSTVNKDSLRLYPAFSGEELESISGSILETVMQDVNDDGKEDLVVPSPRIKNGQK